jgi:K+-sensing histidine kinase KdpD
MTTMSIQHAAYWMGIIAGGIIIVPISAFVLYGLIFALRRWWFFALPAPIIACADYYFGTFPSVSFSGYVAVLLLWFAIILLASIVIAGIQRTVRMRNGKNNRRDAAD